MATQSLYERDFSLFMQGVDKAPLQSPAHKTVESGGYEAIEWMERNIPGSASIAEAGNNNAKPRATSATYWTGLPALLSFAPQQEELQSALDQAVA